MHKVQAHQLLVAQKQEKIRLWRRASQNRAQEVLQLVQKTNTAQRGEEIIILKDEIR